MLTKYWAPGPRFDANKFAAMIRDLGVECLPYQGDVLIDREAFNRIPVDSLPPWVRMNRAGINNPLCTAENWS